MTIDVSFQIQDGKVMITVNGQPYASAEGGTIVYQRNREAKSTANAADNRVVSVGNVGATNATDDAKGGGGPIDNPDVAAGGPHNAPGLLVIGPIVIGVPSGLELSGENAADQKATEVAVDPDASKATVGR